MRYDDFRWKGILASQMGVLVTEQAEYIRPEEEVSTITVPGRSGTLRPLNGRRWQEVVYAPQCAIKPGADLEAIYQWLRGDGLVTFGSMPEHAFQARISNQIDFRLLLEGMPEGWRTLTPVWICQPYRYQAAPDAPVTLTPTSAKPFPLHNPGSEPAAPSITVHGSGDITLTISGSAVSLKGLSGGIIMDSDMQDAYKLDKSGLLNDKMTGDFLMIPPGDVFVNWSLGSGASMTSIEIQPQWRWV